MTGDENGGPIPTPLQRWKVGDVTITKVVEQQALFDLPALFPQATVEDVLALPWLQPHFLTPEGRGVLSVHALVVDTPAMRIIVDTCVGNDKIRQPWAHYSNLQTGFLRDLQAAGFARESFDVVLCTHLHVDHVGWNTMLVEGRWRPTFPNARYLLNEAEFNYWMTPREPQSGDFDAIQWSTFEDSVRPVVDDGLVDLVKLTEGTYAVCDEVSLIPTPGHSPGHVSVRISSEGQTALITGDMAHHPCQLAHLEWGVPRIDFDYDQAIDTRRRVFEEAADTPMLVIGTHWAGVTAGRIKRRGDAYWLDWELEENRCT